MSNNPALDIASAIQSVSIKRNPSPDHDINPSTAASAKAPAVIVRAHSPTNSLSSATSTIPSEILVRPVPRRKSFPAIPDFRFEQSYLASISKADSYWTIAYITARDQVLMPLTQGLVWNLLQSGWKFWNRGSQFAGAGIGTRIRKWWWGVNKWPLPREARSGVTPRNVRDFYEM